MNPQLIEKVIKSNDEQCPEFVFTNPLLDRNVASALSKSYVNFLRPSNQNLNTNNIRHTVLTNIRKMCKIEPDNHLFIDDNSASLISDCYFEHLSEIQDPTTIEKTLDAFLIRKLKDTVPNNESVINPDIIQALININGNLKLQNLSDSIIHWNTTNKHSKILKDLWTSDNEIVSNDISIKIKSEIESFLLNICHHLLVNKELDLVCIFSSNNMKHLIKKCSISSQCFQICYSIINYLFIKTNFDYRMQIFIPMLVKYVRLECAHTAFSVLYSSNLSHVVILLDFDVDILPGNLKKKYIEKTLYYLCKVHKKSESDLILLLSHFPKWFDIYFNSRPHECP